MSYVALAPSRRVGVFVAFTKVDLDMLQRATKAANGLVGKLSRE